MGSEVSAVLQVDHLHSVQCLSCAVQDRDMGEATDMRQLDVWLLQDYDAASGRQASLPCLSIIWLIVLRRQWNAYRASVSSLQSIESRQDCHMGAHPRSC